jgi:hypothetical protein
VPPSTPLPVLRREPSVRAPHPSAAAPASDPAALRRLVVTFLAGSVLVVALLSAVPSGTPVPLAAATVSVPVVVGAAAGLLAWLVGRFVRGRRPTP